MALHCFSARSALYSYAGDNVDSDWEDEYAEYAQESFSSTAASGAESDGDGEVDDVDGLPDLSVAEEVEVDPYDDMPPLEGDDEEEGEDPEI